MTKSISRRKIYTASVEMGSFPWNCGAGNWRHLDALIARHFSSPLRRYSRHLRLILHPTMRISRRGFLAISSLRLRHKSCHMKELTRHSTARRKARVACSGLVFMAVPVQNCSGYGPFCRGIK